MVLKNKFILMLCSLLALSFLYTTSSYAVEPASELSTDVGYYPYATTPEETIAIDPKIKTKSSIYDGTGDWKPGAVIPVVPSVAPPIAPVNKNLPVFTGLNNKSTKKAKQSRIFLQLTTSAGQYFSSSSLPLSDEVTVTSFGGRLSLGYINLNKPQYIYKLFVEQFEAKGSTDDISYDEFFLNKITTTNIGTNFEYILPKSPNFSLGGGLGYTTETICAGENACTVSRDHNGGFIETFANFRYKVFVSSLNLQQYLLTSADEKEKANGLKANIAIGLAFNLY